MTYKEIQNEILQMEEDYRIIENKKKRVDGELSLQVTKWEEYKEVLYKEKKDVEVLEKNSLYTLFSKMVGNYDQKHEKEYKEYLQSKEHYDQLSTLVEELKKQKTAHEIELFNLQKKIKQYKIRMREEYPEGKALAKEEALQRKTLYAQQKELTEALGATRKVYSLAQSVHTTYKSANNWATYDTFFNGGIIADMAKYSKIDEATKLTYQMQAASKQMEKELADVEIVFNDAVDQIEGSTRVWDIAFDNIFSDWSVKNRIQDNMGKLERYLDKLEALIQKLERKKDSIERRLKQDFFD